MIALFTCHYVAGAGVSWAVAAVDSPLVTGSLSWKSDRVWITKHAHGHSVNV